MKRFVNTKGQWSIPKKDQDAAQDFGPFVRLYVTRPHKFMQLQNNPQHKNRSYIHYQMNLQKIVY